ncbi:MAG: sigma-54-dependent Fis family transcriptional regulator [Bacteroidetes bacterium]|nr:sigma-54-dependent Fis family transcriptional regulator [Bacteroidota bacterium]
MESVQAIKQRFGIIGNDTALNRAIEKAIQVSPTDISVIVTGESGVGKESIPKIIHQLSHRKHSKYIAVNCGAIPEGTIDSELFGHEKGAFTGADKLRKGRFELADGGTLLLDEISEVSPTTQAKLLRILQERTFERVGSSTSRTVDVRVIATTNRDLPAEVAKGTFRQDLYFRLNVLPLRMPPLREIIEELDELAENFLKQLGAREGKPLKMFEPGVLQLLREYSWPGNVRELQNMIERAIILSRSDRITKKELTGLSLGSGSVSGSGGVSSRQKIRPMAEVEKEHINFCLEQLGWNMSECAERLGMHRNTLRAKIKEYGLTRSE